MVLGGVRLGPPGSDTVAMWARVQGEFFTPLDFRAFPFDSQKLTMQLEYADPPPVADATGWSDAGERAGKAGGAVNFLPSATGLATFKPRAGADVSGWTVRDVSVTPAAHDPESRAERVESGARRRSRRCVLPPQPPQAAHGRIDTSTHSLTAPAPPPPRPQASGSSRPPPTRSRSCRATPSSSRRGRTSSPRSGGRGSRT